MRTFFNQDLVNKYFPEATMIPPMLVNKIPAGKENLLPNICESGEYFLQLKKDGYYYTYNKTCNYSYLFSRNVSKTNSLLTDKMKNVPHIEEALSFLPQDTVLVGEIYYPGKTSKTVTTIMGCLPEKAIARQKDAGLIHYYIHDIIMYKGVNLMNTDAWTRYRVLEKVMSDAAKAYDFIELAISETNQIETRIIDALAAGEEGVVLKRKDGIYAPGDRPAWVSLKIKQTATIEAIISDITYGAIESSTKELESWQFWKSVDEAGPYYKGDGYKGYLDGELIPVTKWAYYGIKTTLIISAIDKDGYAKEITRIKSGLSDEMINDMNENPDKYIGEVCEIECMSLDKINHTVRHGRFKKMREDKLAEDCTIDCIFS